MSGRLRQIGALALAALLVDLVLIQPNHPGAVTWQALEMFPLELPAILLGLAALGDRGRGPRWLRRALAGLLLLIVAVKLADLASFVAFNRGFDPVTDYHLVSAGARLLAGSVGVPLTVLLFAAALGALAGLGWLIARALGTWARLGLRGAPRGAAAAVAILFAAVSVAEIGHIHRAWTLPANPPGSAFTARLAYETARDAARSRDAFRDFARAARSDAMAGREDLFDALDRRDVTVMFVESYGRASLDNPLYAPTHRATLEAGAAAVREAGLAIRSGWLTSPIQGGQSWLAHASFASGLTIDDQRRYRALLASPRATLFELASDAGYRTAAVAPAIVLPWPEGPQMGFETILAARDLGYAGQPFNWVTMPDQYTLSAWRDRLPPDPRPLFAEIALISSHAPWTPVPELVDWEAVGDGTVFDAMAASGDSPEVVWSDPDRVREQYRKALDYTLRTVFSDAARPGDEPPLIVVLGDHPAAEFVSGPHGRDVPVHLIGPPGTIALFDGWGWTDGAVPAGDLSAWPMAAFRDRFLAATAGTGVQS